MRYFMTASIRKQTGGSCYFEFQKGQRGKNDELTFWKEDSLYLHMDIADEIALYRIVPNLNYYGETVVDKEKWDMMQNNAKNAGVKAMEVINELRGWVEDNFRNADHFLILGL